MSLTSSRDPSLGREMHQAGRGSQSKLPCQHRASQPLWVGRELEGLVGGLSECPGATLLSLYSVTNGKSNQGGLPQEVGMKEEQIYTYSIQVTKVLLSIHQCAAPRWVPGYRDRVLGALCITERTKHRLPPLPKLGLPLPTLGQTRTTEVPLALTAQELKLSLLPLHSLGSPP